MQPEIEREQILPKPGRLVLGQPGFRLGESGIQQLDQSFGQLAARADTRSCIPSRQRLQASLRRGGFAGRRCLGWKQIEIDRRIGNFNRFFGICGGAAKFPHPRIQSGQRFGATRRGLLQHMGRSDASTEEAQ